MTRIKYIGLFLAIIFAGCTSENDMNTIVANADPQELQGIKAMIDNGSTRAGMVTPLADYVGRSDFKGGDRIMFTEIRRTSNPISNFTYPGTGNYAGIIFEAGNEGGWSRVETDGGPERVFWTDAVSNHTFVAFSIPQVAGYDWKSYQFTEGSGEDAVKKTYYIGSLGDPTLSPENDTIDYTLTEEEQTANTATENDMTVYRNPKLEDEDLVIAYDTEIMAEPGGSVALVKFHHALSSVRVVVNISGFSSSSSAADNNAVVSNMRLLHQPTMFVWMQSDWGAQPMRASRQDATLTDQEMIDAAWDGSATIPTYDQRKTIKLWIPQPEGSGEKQSKTFTFYGITTPQPADYISTLPENNINRKAQLQFDVTYPNPMQPSVNVTKTYTASLDDVHFEAGYNTTINIALNHKNEQMTVGAEYENWQFVATPDIGQLKKNSTFLQDTQRANVTILGDDNATIDDATWLYELTDANNITTVYDIYGHTGSKDSPYQISTAYQLLSFAYEVQNGNTFEGKYIRLDADITLQSTSEKTKDELDEILIDDNNQESTNPAWSEAAATINWIGIGDAENAFNGTFLGGKRFIYRLKGSPLFYSLGPQARIEQLQVNTITMADGSAEVIGSGLYANTNDGLICGCKVVGDVVCSATPAGAFVGTNGSTGILWASYHIGATSSTSASPSVGGLAGSNSGVIASCYNAGKVTGTTTGGITASSTGTLHNNYYNSTLLTAPTITPASGVTGQSTGDMTKQQFVTDLNTGISVWRSTDTEHGGLNHSDYHAHYYVYQPANYPKLNETFESQDQTP